MDSIIKGGQKDTEASIPDFVFVYLHVNVPYTKVINGVFISCITDWTQTKLIKAKTWTKVTVPYQ